MRAKSIRARLTATFSLCLALLMIAAVCGLIWYSKSSAERNADSLIAAVAKRAMLESSDSKEHYNPSEMIEELGEDLRGSNLALSVTDGSGKVIGKSQRNAPGLSSVHDRDWRASVVKLENGDTVVVGMPWAKTRNSLNFHAIALLSLGAFVVLIASVGAWFLVGRALTPIPLLARQAKASSADDNLAISLKPPSEDREMVELVDTLNGLLRRVTETAAAKGRFYSAASHELRTPLQALSGHLELALSRDRTKEEYKAAAEEAYVQTRRLIALVRALLFLYQLDSSTALPASEPVDLVNTCKRSLSHSRPLIQDRGLRVNVQTPPELSIIAPPSHIDMLVRNIVENAAKYAPEHGLIDLSLTSTAHAIQLEISNECAAPPNWNVDELFEPFSRPDASRNAKTGGTGLGLAICKAIADANDWELSLLSEQGTIRAVIHFSAEHQTGSRVVEAPI